MTRVQLRENITIFAVLIGGIFCRGRKAEESPGRKGHPAAEIAGGSNLSEAVTENNNAARKGGEMVKTRGKSSRLRTATFTGYGTGACKTKYTDS